MTTIEKLMAQNHSGPLKSPLRLVCAAVGEIKTYGAQEKKMIHVGLCDSSGKAKGVVFDGSHFPKFVEGRGVVLHNAVYNNRELVINSQTKVFQCAMPAVPDSIIQEALHLIRPPAPKVTPIKVARKSPSKERLTIRGKITSEGLPKPVTVNNRQVEVKTITVQDAEDEIKVSLWRDLARQEVQLGDVVEVTHIVVNEKRYGGEESLSTTQFSTIMKTEMPTEEDNFEVLGVEIQETTCQLVTMDKGIFVASNELLLAHFTCTLEELSEKFPCSVTIKAKGQEIVAFLK